ncbi:phosphoribosylglycinamide formyltransferase [Gammaproteobacteria bacterium]|nr:phosphoribosylglycinamide formyltransferase [Gammaproteobacteria bacterium]
MSTKECVVLFSGNGSNLENLLNKRNAIKDKLNYISAFTDNVKARGVDICKRFNLDICIGQKDTLNKDLNQFLENNNPDLIILSGYMKIIPELIVNKYLGKIINLHPSLLPKYPGLNTYEKVIKNNDREHGATVHFVTKDLDAGPIILQGSFDVREKITKKELEERTHQAEYKIYPIVIEWFAEDIIEFRDGDFYLKGNRISVPIVYQVNDSHD